VTASTYFSSVDTIQGNVMVAKVSPDGKSMVYETHIGGSNGDRGWGIALDSSGNVYLTGNTSSGDFPLVPATNNLTTKLATDRAAHRYDRQRNHAVRLDGRDSVAD